MKAYFSHHRIGGHLVVELSIAKKKLKMGGNGNKMTHMLEKPLLNSS